MANLRLIGPGRHSDRLLAAVRALPRHGQHGYHDPTKYRLLWVVTDAGTPVAYATSAWDADDETMHLDGCWVAPAYRGLGLQRRLLRVRVRNALRRGARRVRTYAAADNVWSIRNILRCGLARGRDSDGFWTFVREFG